MVTYQRPARGLSTLTAYLRATDGNPARTYEYITGYGSGGRSSHNADSNGVAHAVDIFVGPGNLSEARGIELSEQLRAEGKRGIIPGHPDRLAYIIHRGRIAGDHTNWEWIPYTGADWHGDHIHVSSVFDYLWGERVAGNPADYDSTAPWELGPVTKPQSGTITPIKEDTLSAAEVKEIKDHINNVLIGGYTWNGKKHYGIAPILEETQKRLGAVPAKVWAATISRNGKIPVIQEIADAKTNTIKLEAQLAALTAVVGQLAKGQNVTIDYDRITAAVQDTIKESVQGALADGIDINAEITVAGTK